MRSTYIEYLRGHESAMRTLEAVSQRPDVASFLRSAGGADERARGTSLAELLQRPLERLAELRDLFEDLVALSQPSEAAQGEAASCRNLLSQILHEGAVGASKSPFTASPQLGAAAGIPSARLSAHARTVGGGEGGAPTAASYSAAASLQRDTEVAFAPHRRLLGGGQAASAATAEARASSAIPVPSYVPGESGGKPAAPLTAATAADADRAKAEADDAERRVAAAEAALVSGRDQLRKAHEAADLRAQEQALVDTESERDAMEAAMARLRKEEEALYDRLASSDSREMFETFLHKKRELQAEEARLLDLLEQHENTLAQLRERLANPPEEVLPADPAKRQLYIAWKTALRDREEILRQARARKHRLMRDLREQHETQVILLEMQRRSAVDGLREAVEEERRKADSYRRELADLDRNIDEARETMKSFRKEFEDLRVALLVDRMAKASQVATLTQRRKQLEDEASAFREQIEAARERVAAEEAAKWEAKLQNVKEEGERRVQDTRTKGLERLERVREDMARSFEESFRPLLQDAEDRHRKELETVEQLRAELRSKEEELSAAERQAANVAGAAGGRDATGTEDDGEDEDVPEWKLREFEELKRYVTDMWERLEVPDEDVVEFLSECEMLAPFDERVLSMYKDMYRRLADGDPAVVGQSVEELEEPRAAGHEKEAGGPKPSLGRDLARAVPDSDADGAFSAATAWGGRESGARRSAPRGAPPSDADDLGYSVPGTSAEGYVQRSPPYSQTAAASAVDGYAAPGTRGFDPRGHGNGAYHGHATDPSPLRPSAARTAAAYNSERRGAYGAAARSGESERRGTNGTAGRSDDQSQTRTRLHRFNTGSIPPSLGGPGSRRVRR